MINGGVASLHFARTWNLQQVLSESLRTEYEEIIEKVLDGFSFMQTIHATRSEVLDAVDFFISHEGLLLNYEQALTSPFEGKYYNLGAHSLWIGDRTRSLDGAHIEYFRGIANPIGIKVGPTMKDEELAELVQVLNPSKEFGRICLITRYGHNKVAEKLPGHIASVRETSVPVLWCCDPCHGNTEVTENGLKPENSSILYQSSFNHLRYTKKMLVT
jgi:3-deoxy-7-phosphoheptulonate synthase